ncbi:hypothetical protein C9F11_36465 [Streptomyces sp. YIM 121038]|nr:hypothetical protein C9F11_36465 [Streptomyces sp. YIM 121038]
MNTPPPLGIRARPDRNAWPLSGAPRLTPTTPGAVPDPRLACASHAPFMPSAAADPLTERDLPQQPAQDFDFSNLDVPQRATHTVQTTVANDPHTNHTCVAKLREERPRPRRHAARHEI